MSDQNTANVSARDLLLDFLSLRMLSPELTDWNEEQLSENPPRLFRLRRLIALFRAFEIPWDPSSFIEGGFIQTEDPRYVKLFESMSPSFPKLIKDRAECSQLRSYFEILFKYRERICKVTSFSSGLYTASGLYLYAFQKINEMENIIGTNIHIIDDLLIALISPEGRNFSVDQLVEGYAYPDVDLFDIDTEFW